MEKIDKKELANKIKGLRILQFGDERGSVRKFADFLGVKYTTYRDNESGKIGIEVLKALHERMGVDINLLLTGRAEPLQAPIETIPLQTPEEKEYLEKLLDVLRNPNTKKAIQESIDTYLKVPKPIDTAPFEKEKKGKAG